MIVNKEKLCKKCLYLFLFIILSFFLFACNNNKEKNIKNTIENNKNNDKYIENKEEEKHIIYNLSKEISEAKMIIQYEDDASIEDFDTVYYGYFNQDGDMSNGFENIEWIILDKDDKKALLMSKYILEYKNFGENISGIFENHQINEDTKLIEDTFILSANEMLKYFCKDEFKETIEFLEINNEYCGSDEYKDELLKPFYENINNQIAFNKTKTTNTDFVKFKKRYMEENYNNSYWTSTKTIPCDYAPGYSEHATIVGDDEIKDFQYYFEYSNTGGMFGSPTHEESKSSLGVRPCIYIDLNIFNKNEDIVINKYEKIEEKNNYSIVEIDKAKTIEENYNNIYVDYIDTVTFGEYYNEYGFNEAKKDKLEWLVLSKNEKEAILLSKNILFPKRFHDKYENIKFIDSTLCNYLNTEFIKEAFTDEEQNKMGIMDCENVSIKVSILSENDIKKYFRQYEKNKTLSSYGTKIAYQAGLKKYDFNNEWFSLNENYWIIDKTDEEGKYKYVDNKGVIDYKGAFVDTKNIGVRPIIKINFDNDIDNSLIKYDDYLKINETNYEKSIKTKKINDNRKIIIGKYNQDNNEKNGKEGIEWQILDKDENTTLLISKNILDAKEFDDKKIITTWENSTLRKWLNEEFYKNAFNEKEKSIIEKIFLKNYDTPFDYADSGNDTEDYVFIPGINEYRKYLLSNDVSKSLITKEVANDKKLPKRVYDTYDLNNYWLRTQNTIENDTVSNIPTLDALYNTLPDIYADKNYTNLIVDEKGNINSLSYYFEAWTSSRGYIYSDKKAIKNVYFCGVRPMIRVKNEFIESYIKNNEELNYVYIKEKGNIYNIDKILQAKTIKEYNEKDRIDSFDTIKFGKYHFADEIKINSFIDDNIKKENIKDIEWIVLEKDVEHNKALLLSKYSLLSCNGSKNYFESDIRNVLNNEFIKNSFSDDEKQYILTTDLTNDLIKIDEIKDKIFLLSNSGVDEYFDNKERKLATTYINQNTKFSTTPYFLTTINEEDIMFSDGMLFVNSIGEKDYTTFGEVCGVRPCMWIKIDKNIYEDDNSKLDEKKYDDNDSFDVKVSKIDEIADIKENNIDKIPVVGFGKFVQNEERDYKKPYQNDDYCEYDKENKKNWDDIEWFVIKKEPAKVLLMSKDILYNVLSPEKRYIEKKKENKKEDNKYDIGKEYSENDIKAWNIEISNWLNNDFYNDAFDDKEKSMILESNIIKEKTTIQPKVFILSLDEIMQYFPFYDRIDTKTNREIYIPKITSKVTKWAGSVLRHYSGTKKIKVENNIYRYGYGRSPFAIRDADLSVNSNGDISDNEYNHILGIRPCIWVKMDESLK